MRTIYLLLILSFGVSNCFAQTASFRNFSIDDGLAQSQIYTILQDHKGYLWLGTRGGGLSRFDGRSFYTYSEQQGLSSNYISSLLQDEGHQIWVGTANGLSVYNGSRFRKIPTDYKTGIAVTAIVQGKDRQLFCGTNHGLFELIGGKLKQKVLPKIDREISIYALYCSANSLFLGTGQGLYEYNFKTSSTVYHGVKWKVMKNAITKIVKDKSGRLLIGTYGDGMYCYDWKMFYRPDLHHELYKETVFDFYCEKDKIWIATLAQGLVEYDIPSKKFIKYTQTDGLANNHVRAIIKDRCGDLWLGTSGGGLSQFSKKIFSHYTTTSGLGGNFVYSIYRDSKGQLWMGTAQNGVSVMQNGTIRQLNKDNGFEAIKVKAIVEGDSGKMYFGTEGQGIGILENGEFHWMKGTTRYYIKQMVRDQSGIIWVASVGNGLLRIDPNEQEEEMTKIMTRQGCIDTRLTTVHADSRGMIWYGSETKGIGCYNPETKKHIWITEEKGLVSNTIRTITSDNSGRIWVGTAGFGIMALDARSGKVLKCIGVKNGLHSSNVYCMIFDNRNNLLVGTESGLNQLRFDKNLNVKRTVNYSRGEGFLGVETCQNSIWKDANGKVWIGTVNGVTAYNSDNKQLNKVPPVLNLVDIQLFYESLRKTNYSDHVLPWNQFLDLSLPYDENHLSFIFKGINLRNPEAVEYSWKMEGFDESWSPWTKDQRITYSNLPSGNFTFLVRARNEDGIYSKEPLRFQISVSTPYWRTTWFYVSLFVLTVIILVSAFRFQSKRIKEKARKAQEQAELEKNLVELEQKALRLQMNPHFIFNALNSIQGLIGTEHETKARYYLAKFSRLMRQILDNSRKTTITLEEEIATLENYLLVEQFCTGNRFDYEITTELMTEANYIEIPPMLVQPFVENAIKHGFRFSPEQMRRGKISIHFAEEQHGIQCTITDNGIGRKASEEMKTFDESPKHESKGLTVTEERLQLLGDGQRVEIIDLFDEKNESCGTQINLFIPF